MIQFVELNQVTYDAMQTRNADHIYFTTDTNRIYKGSVCYTPTNVIDVTTLDSTTKKSLVGLMMPSDSFTDITVTGGSGTHTTKITIQSDGYLTVRGTASDANASIELSTCKGETDHSLCVASKVANANELIAETLPVKSGSSVDVVVTNCNITYLRLFPAVGSI